MPPSVQQMTNQDGYCTHLGFYSIKIKVCNQLFAEIFYKNFILPSLEATVRTQLLFVVSDNYYRDPYFQQNMRCFSGRAA